MHWVYRSPFIFGGIIKFTHRSELPPQHRVIKELIDKKTSISITDLQLIYNFKKLKSEAPYMGIFFYESLIFSFQDYLIEQDEKNRERIENISKWNDEIHSRWQSGIFLIIGAIGLIIECCVIESSISCNGFIIVALYLLFLIFAGCFIFIGGTSINQITDMKYTRLINENEWKLIRMMRILEKNLKPGIEKEKISRFSQFINRFKSNRGTPR